MKPCNITTGTIEAAWFETMSACFALDPWAPNEAPMYAYRYRNERGSFDGEGNPQEAQFRHQLQSLSLHLTAPHTRPLSPILFDDLGKLNPIYGATVDEREASLETYFAEYFMNPKLARNEEYRYSTFIQPWTDEVIIPMLQKTPFTNHAAIIIGQSMYRKNVSQGFEAQYDPTYANAPVVYKDPPCLRQIQWMWDGEGLDIHAYFRSWDLFQGLPSNLAGLQHLNEYVSDFTGLPHRDMYVYSPGAHCYQTAIPIVAKLLRWTPAQQEYVLSKFPEVNACE